MKRYGVIGWKNAGKTTLIEKLVQEITARGLSVSTLKHAHHGFEIDHEGKDSWIHRQAGAREVLVASEKRWALMSELRGAAPPDLDALIAKMTPVDLVLIEGFKRASHPKIEVRRGDEASAHSADAAAEGTVRAIASDRTSALAIDLASPAHADAAAALPQFHIDDAAGIASFLLADVQLATAGRATE